MAIDAGRLRQRLGQIDGRGYKAYREIKGRYQFADFQLTVEHVQGDPFAAPSRLTISLPLLKTRLGAGEPANPERRVGIEDAFLRAFAKAVRSVSGGGHRGSGKSGEWGVIRLGQEMLPRTACEIENDHLFVRVTAGLPARGRRVLSRQAETMFFTELPQMVRTGVFEASPSFLRAHADSYEDQETLREFLKERNWVAFVANGSLLPRRTGVDDRPLENCAVAWASPSQLETEVQLPNSNGIKGTFLPAGVSLICGGGFHGKSTLLQALSRGVYNHIPGDGRELCVSRHETVAVRAEDGRSITAVDISPFIDGLPDGRRSTAFDTDNASGSTSQAANIGEGLELGAECLLIDEDTSATNFMVRDRRMQELIAVCDEPITPFVDRVVELYREHGVSTVVVVGGSGDYFDVADLVLVMNKYRARVETTRAKEIADEHPSNRLRELRPSLARPNPRVPLPAGFDPRQGKRPEKVRTKGVRSITFGIHEIDMGAVAQVVDPGQVKTLGDWLLACSRHAVDGRRSLANICRSMEDEARRGCLSHTTEPGFGDRVMARRFELGAAINRLRTLKIAKDD